MTDIERLEDVLPSWRGFFVNSLLNSAVEGVLQHVNGSLAESVDTGDSGQVGRIVDAVRYATIRRAREAILPACLRWLMDQGHWKSKCQGTRALNEIAGGIQNIAPFEPGLPAPAGTIEPHAWVLPAALGAALGPFAMLPLMFLLPNSREILLYVGGFLGAASLVGLIGYVASRPAMLAGLETGMKWVGIVAVPLVFWRGLRGRPIGWVRAAVSTLGAWLVLATVRPRTRLLSRDEVSGALKDPIRGIMMHEADMVLARCWSHPDRLGRVDPAGSMASELPRPISRAMRDLRTSIRNPSSTREDVVEAVEALLQRVEDVGYRWIEVARGTPYTKSLEPYFEKFGMIEDGQPVVMLDIALCKQDGVDKSLVVVEPGKLQRARNRGE
jgi:hypothetical protein